MMVQEIGISIAFILIAYLLGSIPTGFLAGYGLKKIDIRDYGSGSTGATNVLRVLGSTVAAIVLLIDLLKGAIALGLVKLEILPLPSEQWRAWLIILTALAAIFGHSKSVWLGFSGGKSVATSLGTLLVMTPMIALAAVGIFAITLAISRMVSLGSITSAIGINLLMIILDKPLPYIIFAVLAAAYVIWRHRSNIERILAGTEPKIGQKVSNQS